MILSALCSAVVIGGVELFSDPVDPYSSIGDDSTEGGERCEAFSGLLQLRTLSV